VPVRKKETQTNFGELIKKNEKWGRGQHKLVEIKIAEWN
jgi:hypothetical protein